MRLAVHLELDRSARIPINHQDLLQGVVYGLLGASDVEYARDLHQRGYSATPLDGVVGVPATRRSKLFVYSGLRALARQRRVVGDTLHLGEGGGIRWYVSSPLTDFLNHFVTGLIGAGEIRVGSTSLRVSQVEALPSPSFASMRAEFTCLSPIVAAVTVPDRDTPRYLRPGEADAFSEAIRKNLLWKFRLVHGREPEDDRLRLDFNPGYLSRSSGTKKITFKNTDVVGAFAPFALAGSPELLQLAWECGLGEKNSAGFGMIEGESDSRSTVNPSTTHGGDPA